MSKKLYRVSGICFVPTECTMEVEAEGPDVALWIATQSHDWQSHIDRNGGDFVSAFDWQPFAEEVKP